MQFTVCKVDLMLEGALTSFTVCDAYRYFADQALLMASQSTGRSRTEHLIPTGDTDIIVPD